MPLFTSIRNPKALGSLHQILNSTNRKYFDSSEKLSGSWANSMKEKFNIEIIETFIQVKTSMTMDGDYIDEPYIFPKNKFQTFSFHRKNDMISHWSEGFEILHIPKLEAHYLCVQTSAPKSIIWGSQSRLISYKMSYKDEVFIPGETFNNLKQYKKYLETEIINCR